VVDEEYIVDGSQVDQTEYQIDLVEPLELGVRYFVSYKIKDNESIAGSSHALFIDGAVVLPFSVGQGVYVGTIVGAGQTTASIVATPTLAATFYDVSIREETEDGFGIGWRTLTSFQAPQGHTQNARVGLIRTVGILAGTANINSDAVFDYRVETPAKYPPQLEMPDPSYWDSSLFDNDVWDFVLQGANFTSGALGQGRAFAIQCSGWSETRVNIVAWDVTFTAGGFL
jgi:hypothetical protein